MADSDLPETESRTTEQRLDALATRLARVEQHLGIVTPIAAPKAKHEPDTAMIDSLTAPPALAPPPAPPVEPPPPRKLEVLRSMGAAPAPTASAASPQRPPLAPPIAPPDQSVATAIAAFKAPPIAPMIPPPAVPRPHNATKASAPKRSVELAIGRSWLAWIGAIVILIAGALFITTAYHEGWLNALSPTARCMAVAVFGIALLVAGEWALRKIARIAAVGFYSAGLGTLYLDAYATYPWFNIASPSVAFLLLACVAMLGFALTLRGKSLTIGILSVIGGYFAPLLIGSAAANPAAPAFYFTVLLGIALALSMFAPRPMRVLRYVALAAHLTLATIWADSTVPKFWLVAIVAFTIWWTMIVVEAVVAAMRRQSSTGNVAVTLITSVWYVIIGCIVINMSSPVGFNWLGAFTFAIGALSAAIAFQFGPGLNALRTKPQNAMDKLSLALLLQSGALITIAVALHFDGFGQAVAWLTMGIVAIETGRRLPSRGLDIFGLIVGALGVISVAFMQSLSTPALRATVLSVPNLDITGWTVLAVISILIIFLAGKRLRALDGSAWIGVKVILIVTALLGWALLWSHEGSGHLVTWFWLAAAVGLIVFERFGRRELFFEIGLAALAAVAARWLLADAIVDRLNPHWDPTAALPLFNGQMALALAIACTAWLAVRIARTRPALAKIPISLGERRNADAIIIATLVGAGFLLFALSFEVDRMVMRLAGSTSPAWSIDQIRQLLLTALWACGTVSVQLFAYALRKRGGAAGRAAGTILRVSWIAIILCTGKWMIFDTLLFGFLKPASARFALAPIINVQFITAIAIAAGLVIMLTLMKRSAKAAFAGSTADNELAQRAPFDRAIAIFVPTLVSVLVLWALSFEVERFIGTLEHAGTTFAWPAMQVRALALTMLWSIGAFVLVRFGQWRRHVQLISTATVITFGSAIVWLTLDTLHFRLQGPPTSTTVILNMQCIAGVIAALAIVLVQRSLRSTSLALPAQQAYRAFGWALVGIIILWLGTFEIDRAFVSTAATLSPGQVTARQMCWSVYWSVFAFGLIAVGFKVPAAGARYAGIALFGLTLAKVLILDLAQIHNIYRVASLLAVGVLLIITSMAYAKLAPVLLGTVKKDEIESA